VGDVPTVLFPLRPGKELFTEADATVTREFKFDRSGGVWNVNGEPFDHGARIDALPRLNAVEIWRLENSAGGWVHPIHVHDIPLLLLDRNELPPAPDSDETGLKDTFFLGRGESVRVIGKFTDNRGIYVFHCHNIEHEDQFMMSQFKVG
jgi:FtsP/CotA-like multicopper oxidase with cupredoxin domain